MKKYDDLIKSIAEQYGFYNINMSTTYGNGHINTTFLLEVETAEHSQSALVLQQINNEIFQDVDGLMKNIDAITKHLKKKNIPTFEVLRTLDGYLYHVTEEHTPKYYRMISFLPDTFSYEFTQEPAVFAKSATVLGKFQKALADFPVEQLTYTIPDFHNTTMRYEAFEKAVSSCSNGRISQPDVIELIQFIRERKDKYCSAIMERLADGRLPLRVTHNDTKLSNFLFQKPGCSDLNDANLSATDLSATDLGTASLGTASLGDCNAEALCLIDLDTVMPGTYVHDFGDAIRFGASTALEDEPDLSKVHFDIKKYTAFKEAYLIEMGDVLTEEERECLPLAAINLTYENGIRFLADYINGDTYYKISRETHNLDRAKTQFRLVAEMEKAGI